MSERARMSEAQMYETFAVLDAIERVEHIARKDLGIVEVWVRDARRGNQCVRELRAIPTQDEARAIIAELRAELRARGRETARRLASARTSYES